MLYYVHQLVFVCFLVLQRTVDLAELVCCKQLPAASRQEVGETGESELKDTKMLHRAEGNGRVW